jgi:peptide/nickel transport system substrate-binding protein
VLAVVLAVWGPPPRQASSGNVLRIATNSPPDYLDPAMSYQVVSWQTMINAYNGLLTYPKTDAEGGGAELVPDLAAAMPTLKDGGRTVRFTVRKGVQFGPPANRELLPSDVKYGIQRSLWMNSPGQGFYTNIKGAAGAVGEPKTDVAGIVADDTARTITFHLERPDATFLYALALPFSFAVPAGTPTEDMSGKGFVPATGPYMFTKYSPQRSIVLERNPNFRSWTEHVPNGNVDGITISLGVNPDNAVTLIKRGKVDFMFDPIPRSQLPSLLKSREWKKHVHVTDAARTLYIFFDTRNPPFDKLQMRQAINWAIDREAMVKLTGGQGVPSENILPPSMPGRREHKLYPGPDMDKARALIQQAGVTPGPIEIWCRTTEPNPTLAQYLQGVMNELGFQATIKCVDPSNFFTLVGNENTKASIGFANWGQDFPEGSNFIDVLLNGARITPEHSNNLSYYSGADKEIAKANALMDPEARNKAWGDLDEQIIADAAWAPYMHWLDYKITSKRLDNFVAHPVYDMLFMQVKLKGEKPSAAEPAQALPPGVVQGGGALADDSPTPPQLPRFATAPGLAEPSWKGTGAPPVVAPARSGS